MTYTFLKGVILGLLISITIGPAFFAIIQTGINRGFKTGIFMALGIIISDLTLIVLCFLGASAFLGPNGEPNPQYNLYLGIIGGVILIIFGSVTFIKKPDILKQRHSKYKTPARLPGPVTYVLKGYFLNILNPFLIFFWFAAMNWVRAHAEDGKLLNYAIFFFSGTLITVFATDVLKSFIGGRIKKYLKLRLLIWINRGVGITLVTFGIILIFTTIREFL